MRVFYSIIFAAIILTFPLFVKAQANLVFYHADESFGRATLNPAFLASQEKLSFSFAPIAGANVSLNDTKVLSLVSDLLFFEEANNVIKEIFRKTVSNKLFFQQGNFTWVNLAYKHNTGIYSFTIADKANVMLDISGKLSQFMIDNNALNVVIDEIQDFPAEAQHYREYSFGYTREILPNRLTMGIRAKMLFGKSLLSSNATAVISQSNTDYLIQTGGNIIVSLPAERVMVNNDLTKLDPLSGYSISDYILNRNNSGFAFDIGFSYAFKEDWELSASIVNFGQINWKTYMHDLKFDGNYKLDNTDYQVINGMLVKTTDEVSLENELSKIFDIKEAEDISYSNSIPTSFIAGIAYNYTDRIKFGIVERLITIKDFYFNSISLTANYKLNNRLSLTTGYAMHGDSYFNIPAASVYKWQGGQAFLSVDNVIPFISDFQGISFGCSFYIFGSKMKYDRIDYLPFYKHKKKRKTNNKGLIWKGREKNK